MFNIILEQTLLSAITQVQRAMKVSVVLVRNCITKMKQDCSVLARCGSSKNVLENNFSANFKDVWVKLRC